MRGFQPWDWGLRLQSWVSCLRPCGYAKGGDQAIIGPGRPLLASICRPATYFPNIFEKNPCFLTFSSRKDPSRFASACGAPPLPPLPPMRTISCKKGDFT